MEAFAVDGRSAVWETWDPTFRVAFWSDGAVDEWDVRGVGMPAALEWATAHAAGREFVLYAVVQHHGEGVIRLLGTDPTRVEGAGGASSFAADDGDGRSRG